MTIRQLDESLHIRRWACRRWTKLSIGESSPVRYYPYPSDTALECGIWKWEMIEYINKTMNYMPFTGRPRSQVHDRRLVLAMPGWGMEDSIGLSDHRGPLPLNLAGNSLLIEAETGKPA